MTSPASGRAASRLQPCLSPALRCRAPSVALC
jgi:hypothetical protein